MMAPAGRGDVWRVVRVALAMAAVIGGLLFLLSRAPAFAQAAHEGRHGVGHDHWHGSFYSKLKRRDNQQSCCNLTDCVPTQSRMVDDGYEVLVEGEWTPVPPAVIQNVTAPDGGAHVCFPKPSAVYPKGTLFCVVLPPEG